MWYPDKIKVLNWKNWIILVLYFLLIYCLMVLCWLWTFPLLLIFWTAFFVAPVDIFAIDNLVYLNRCLPNPKCFYDLHVSVFEIIMYFKGWINGFLSRVWVWHICQFLQPSSQPELCNCWNCTFCMSFDFLLMGPDTLCYPPFPLHCWGPSQ